MSGGIHPQQNPLFEHVERFGQVTVLERWTQNRKRGPKYKVGCACGHRFIATGADLRLGRVTSCGECAAKRSAT